MDHVARSRGAVPGASGRTLNGGALLRLAFAFVAVFVTIEAVLIGLRDPLLLAALDNDSAMRLVSVRDLLAGQGWFDLTQRRLGLEGGTEMHWSRLVDAPIAGLILLFDLALDRASAERAALVLWPLLLLGIAAAVAWGIGGTLGGAAAGVLSAGIALLALRGTGRFAAGVIDHHNVQAVLLLALVLGLVRRVRHWRWPVLAGLATAAALAIGVETLPILAAGGATLALLWALDPMRERAAAVGYGVSLSGGLGAIFLATAPASAWTGGFCDALSLDLLALVLPAGLGLGLTALLFSRGAAAARVLALGLLGAGIVALCLSLAPACLSNPIESIGPYLEARWLDHVAEAQGLGSVLTGAVPAANLGYYAVGVMAAAAAIWLAVRERSGGWAVLSACIAAALAIAAYQIRGAYLLLPLCVIPAGVLAVRCHALARERNRPLLGLAAPVLALLPLPNVWNAVLEAASPSHSAVLAQDMIGTAADPATCWTGEGAARLAALPAGTVSANSNLGSALLLFTPHRALSAPYHRNVDGMTSQLRIALAATDGEARAELADAGADYLVLCRPDGEVSLLADAGFAGFLRRLEGGDVPPFLVPLSSPDDPLQVFRVD